MKYSINISKLQERYMPAKVNKSVTILRAKSFHVVVENITLTNGVTTDIHILRHPGSSGIIPIKENKVVLIKQYRHAIGDYIWEIPAGTFDPEETPIACAKRELIEEAGYSANIWKKLGEIIPVPGYSDERMHVFLATDLTPAEQKLDSDELLDVHEIEIDEVMEMISTGKIYDCKTISGLFMAANWLKRNEHSPPH